MKNKVVVFNGEVEAVELPAVELGRGQLLVKPSAFYLGFPDRAVVEGREPVLLPRILGTACAGRVVEASGSDTQLSGKYVVLSPIAGGVRSVLDVDGFLRAYVAVEPSMVYKSAAAVTLADLLEPFAEHAIALASRAKGSAVVVGCDIVGVSAALYLKLSGFEPSMACASGAGVAKRLELKVFKSTSDLPPRADAVVASAEAPGLLDDVLSRVEAPVIALSGFLGSTAIRLRRPGETLVIRVDDAKTGEARRGVVREVAELVGGLVRSAEIRDVGDAVGFLPPRGLGVALFLRQQTQTL